MEKRVMKKIKIIIWILFLAVSSLNLEIFLIENEIVFNNKQSNSNFRKSYN